MKDIEDLAKIWKRQTGCHSRQCIRSFLAVNISFSELIKL